MEYVPNCPHCGKPVPPGSPLGICPECLLKAGSGTQAKADAGAKFEPPPPEKLATFFPQLEILELIGQGGMGAVYKARQPALDRLVALKILPPRLDDDPGFAERFTREARTLAKLSHPNIVAVYDFGQSGGYRYFLMEYVDGLNLRQIERAGKLSSREALGIIPQLCEALQFAHDAGIVHRDIKPENILVDKRGRVKIADFGLAKLLGQEASDYTITEVGHVMGTPHYMAPEQVEHPLEVDHRADIYSLGVVFYEMLTGELPLGRFSSPSQKVRIDVRLDEVVMRSLEKEPERRYQQVSQLRTAVENIAANPGAGGGTPPPIKPVAAFAQPDANPPPVNADDLARQILGRNYYPPVGHCLSRAWKLVMADFWPIVGTYLLFFLLTNVLSSSHGKETGVVGLIVAGPLVGGLHLYYLKKIRRQSVGLDTFFSGFSLAFLHLFLCRLVTLVLIVIGLCCLILPGIYLAVSWEFTSTLVIDKRLDFWSAMELSRKVISRYWWSFFGFFIVIIFFNCLGLLFFILGIFITLPISSVALMYAYEDIFGLANAVAAPTLAPPLVAASPVPERL